MKNFWKDECGQGIITNSLMIGLNGVVVMVALKKLAPAVSSLLVMVQG